MFEEITMFGWEILSTGNIPWKAGWVDEKDWQIQVPLQNGYKNCLRLVTGLGQCKSPKFSKLQHWYLWQCSWWIESITKKYIEEAITTTDPDIIGISSVLDAEDEENSEGMCNIDHEAASPYTIHTTVLQKASLIDANINSAIMAMLDIVQPKNDDVNEGS
jgi:hypothetical protein